MPIRALAHAQLTPPATPDAAALAQRLCRRFSDRISAVQLQAPSAGRIVPLPPDLPPSLAAALHIRGQAQLYSHQAEAWSAVRRGEHVLIATPTASGKSLCYTLPALSAAIKTGERSLYLFPTKALAQDQLADLLDLSRAAAASVAIHTFDGDTPTDARGAIRLRGDIVISNPDMLHQAVLPHHTKWAQFFETLRFVVIDEVHSYRGVFGAHVANLLRRLRRIASFYGRDPQFILASATIGNPSEHASALIGAPVHAITDSGAPRCERHVLLWNPPLVNRELGIRASTRSQATRIARMAIRSALKTLVFASSRLLTEVIAKYLKDVFDHDPRRPPRIHAYRGGYLPKLRRHIERHMRAGEIDGLVATSALELGVDIGALDVVVLAGYPGTIAATWQRLGRAGRRERAALGVLIASSEALDQYVIRHPEFFFASPPESARIAPDQPLILFDHIRCAAFELPFAVGERFGTSDATPYLEVLAEHEVVHREDDRYEWIADSYPANAVSLRSVADGNFVVIECIDGRNQVLAEVDYASAAVTLYVGAIYLLQSVPYQVERLDWVGRKAFVTRTLADYYTDAIEYTRLKVLACFATQSSGNGECGHGEVHVVRRVTGYKKLRYYTHENIGYGPIKLPDQEMHSTAVWWRLPGTVSASSFASSRSLHDGFRGAAESVHTVATLAAMAERRDLCKSIGTADGSELNSWLAAPFHPPLAGGGIDAFAPTLYLYDNYPGGVGLSEPLYLEQARLIADAAAMVAACPCVGGCPACIGATLATEDHSDPVKAAALRILRLLGAG